MVERKGAGVTDKALNLTEQAFLHAISQELEQGELRFPTSMEVTMRVLEALDDPEMYGGVWPPENIADLIFVSNLIAETRNPFSPEQEDFRHGLARAATFGLDEERLAEVLAESVEERQALMRVSRTRSKSKSGKAT